MPATSPIFVDEKLFLGRDEQQNRFRAALTEVLNPTVSEVEPYIFLLFGIGGMGKTTLARRFRDIALTEVPFEGDFKVLSLDWEERARLTPGLQVGREHISPETVFGVLHGEAVAKGWGKSFKDYQNVVQERAKVEQKAAKALAAGDQRSDFSGLGEVGATVVGKMLRQNLPAMGNSGEKLVQELTQLGIKATIEQLPQMQQALETRLRAHLNPKQFQIFLEPHEQLALALGQGLRKLAGQQWLLVILDTYEIVDRVDPWLRQVMRAAGPRVVWVVSGRSDLRQSRQFGNEYFQGYEAQFFRRLIAYDMPQLAADLVRAYFAAATERPVNDEELAALSRATRGIPLAVRLAADLWRNGATMEQIAGGAGDDTPHEEIVQRLAERYLVHAVKPEDRLALYALALADGDLTQARAMLQPTDAPDYDFVTHLRRLERDYSGVYKQAAQLHAEPAYFLREELRPELRRTQPAIQELNRRAATALQNKLAALEEAVPHLETRCTDEGWVTHAVRLADRLFWLDEEEGWRWLVPRYVEALAYNRGLRRSLQQTADGWRRYFSARGKTRCQKLAALDQWYALFKEDVAAGLDELEGLEQKGWLAGADEAERRAILALNRGLVWLHRDQQDQALRSFAQVEAGLPAKGDELRQQLAEALDELAIKLLWPRGRAGAVPSSAAEELLRKVVAWAPDKAGAWYRRGVALDGIGQKDEAIAAYQRAMALDPQNAAPHNGLGNVYRDLGRTDEAIRHDPRFQALVAGDA
ncbi:MAG: tetratricopeptide repeat protein [Anaerolineae bacterium]